MNSNSIKIRTMKVALALGVILMGIKFLAWFLTHSNAILTDALESIVNVLAGTFALYSLYYAAKPKDEDHPYGHGKIEFMSSGVEGGMIFLAGSVMLIKGVWAFFYPQQLERLDLGLLLTALSGFVNYLLGRSLIKRGKELHSSTMVADGTHLLTDTWSSVGLIAGLGIVYFTGLAWIDSVTTVVLGLMIIYTGFKLIRESVFNLLDKADYERIGSLLELINKERKESWIDIHNLRIVKYGSVVHVDCHMTLPWYYSLEMAHQEVDALGKLAQESFNYEIEFFIHADPCLPQSCAICQLSNCHVRKFPFTKKLEWTLANVLPDAKHKLDT
jgi:cation diffusion facilitator family transporter